MNMPAKRSRTPQDEPQPVDATALLNGLSELLIKAKVITAAHLQTLKSK